MSAHVIAVPLPDGWWAIDCDQCGPVCVVKDTQAPDHVPPVVADVCSTHLRGHGVANPTLNVRSRDV
ncbi:MAG TPA: hypothetical protein VMT27_09855 [Actinomycetes bacterium]|nr:hypothetical protein [Actinomycetes bacterium]